MRKVIEMGILISNIQRFSIQDGPGIRTTVFCMGCSIRCPWCANPENLLKKKRIQYNKDKCLSDGSGCRFIPSCKEQCGFPYQLNPDNVNCPLGALEVFGRECSAEEVYNAIMQDKDYYIQGGGVTFSGGEALLQVDELVPVFSALKQSQTDICIESALFVHPDSTMKALKYADRFIVDIKQTDAELCRSLLGGNISQYTKNLEIIAESKIPVAVRFPVAIGLTDQPQNIERIGEILLRLEIRDLEIFGLHNLGAAKYRMLGMHYEPFLSASEEQLKNIKEKFQKMGIFARIMK